MKRLACIAILLAGCASGRVTDICLIDTNIGKTPETLLCVARIARSERVRFVPNEKDQPWRVTWILE